MTTNPLFGITNEQTTLLRAVDSLREPLKQILNLLQQKNNLENELNRQRIRLSQQNPNSIGRFFLTMLVGTFGCFPPVGITNFLLLCFYLEFFPNGALAKFNYASPEIQKQVTHFLLLGVVLLTLLTTFLFSIIFYFFQRSRIIKNIREIRKFINMIEYEQAALNKQLFSIALSIKNTLPVIPPDYQYSYAVEYIYSCLLNRRATTVGEAVNLYEEQLHRWKMENYAAQLVTIQQQQQATMNQIRNLSALGAAASVAGLFV